MSVSIADEFGRICAMVTTFADACSEIEWQENIREPRDAEHFAAEAIWVICASGMKHAVARLIQNRVWEAINAGTPVIDRFAHKGKAAAIETIWYDRDRLHRGFMVAPDKVQYLETLPWIGGITKYHLAKNLGVDTAKPDVHLQRLADRAGRSVQRLCEDIAADSGYRVATVDLILWWACAHGIVDSRTGRIVEKAVA